MGTRWPIHFQDPAFAPVIERALAEGVRICLADLVVFVVAEIGGEAAAARRLLRQAGEDPMAFERRLAEVDWQSPEAAFRQSSATLIRSAPVIQAFQDQDREAFANALALRWIEVRRRFRDRADRQSLRPALSGPIGRSDPSRPDLTWSTHDSS